MTHKLKKTIGTYLRRLLKNVHFWSRPRKAIFLSTGIHYVFRALKIESDAGIGKKGAFCKGLLSLIFMIMLLLPSEAISTSVTDQLKETLDQLIQVLNDPSLKTPDRVNERREILHQLLKKRFDEQRFAKNALGKYWNDRTEKEKREFISIFSDLLERTYFEKIDTYLIEAGNFSSENIVYIKETVKGSDALIETKIISGNLNEIPIDYRLVKEQGNWYVSDIKIEGVIITRNYRAQFYEMLADMSFRELIEKLRAKQIGNQKTSN